MQTSLVLPNYLEVDLQTLTYPAELRTPAQKLSFPLSAEDLTDIQILENKFNQEEKVSGIAAPQIGIRKQFFIFQVPDDPQFKKWRPDIVQTIPKTVWINPTWHALSEEKSTAYEGCFSVPGWAGPVARYTKIEYCAYDIHDEQITGIAEGYMARVIQHETDHLNGQLYIDLVKPEELITVEAYLAMRAKAMQ